MAFWKRDRDSELDAQLRAARPEPRPEVTHAIADDLRGRRSGLMRGFGRVPLGLAGGLSALMVAAVIALGGVSAPVDAVGSALNFQNAKTKATAKATADQYGTRVNVCIAGVIQIRRSLAVANQLIAANVAVLGRCTGDFRKANDKSPPQRAKPTDDRVNVCVGGILQFRVSRDELSTLGSRAVIGPCPS